MTWLQSKAHTLDPGDPEELHLLHGIKKLAPQRGVGKYCTCMVVAPSKEPRNLRAGLRMGFGHPKRHRAAF